MTEKSTMCIANFTDVLEGSDRQCLGICTLLVYIKYTLKFLKFANIFVNWDKDFIKMYNFTYNAQFFVFHNFCKQMIFKTS